MNRSTITIDLSAIRANARRLRAGAGGAELWGVVKADGYGHGAIDVGRAALEAGATALCVATVSEALPVRDALPEARLIVFGPSDPADVVSARAARLELTMAGGVGPIPEGVPVHLKLDTGMGRWGLSELPAPGRDVVGVMSHFASADSDREFTQRQLDAFLDATREMSGATRHIANSAATLRLPAAHLDAVRCGIALYGISPFGTDPALDGLRPALAWHSSIERVLTLAAGESTGYGRLFVAAEPTRIGIVPVGYADGFRRDLTGTEVRVAGAPARVVGTVSMDALAVALPDAAGAGDVVTLIGDEVLIEEHARVAGTIGYELACGLMPRPARMAREVRNE